jgi:hypothetical protein
MESSIKNTSVSYQDMDFYVYYFLHDEGIEPGSGFLNLTLGSEDDEFERIITRVPADILYRETMLEELVQKTVLNYLTSIKK